MKSALILSAALYCFVFLADANPDSRWKRSLALEKCPENSSLKECTDYAEGQSKSLKYCHRFLIGNEFIEWQSCGIVVCGGDLRLLEEDLSKPYPNCCKRCEGEDANLDI